MGHQNKHSFGKVALLSDSSDPTISREILEVFQKKNIDVTLIDVPNIIARCSISHIVDRLTSQKFSRVFISLTGAHYLSGGHIQGLLDLLRLDYTGSGMLATALANDRVKTKKIWQKMGIATTPFVTWEPDLNWQEIIGLLGFPVAVKSLYSHDQKVFKVVNMDQLKEACQNFWSFEEIIIEPWVVGDEYVVYIVGDQALPPLYLGNLVSESIKKEYYKRLNVQGMQKLAIEAFKAIGGQGLGRVSVVKDLNDDFWILSVDLSPIIMRNCHFTEAANNFGISFELLVEKILATSFVKKTNHQRLYTMDGSFKFCD